MLRWLWIVVILIISVAAAAQDDDEILRAEYDTVYSIDFEAGSGEAVLRFAGAEGDVVSLLAGIDGVIFGAEIELEIRNGEGRSIGTQYDYALQPFVIAELPADDVYTAVVNFSHTEGADLDILIAKTAYITTEPLTVTVGGSKFATLLLLDVDDSDEYILEYTHDRGAFAPHITALDFSNMFMETLLRIGGDGITAWQVTTNLEASATYVVMISDEYSFLYSPSEFSEAEITLSLATQP